MKALLLLLFALPAFGATPEAESLRTNLSAAGFTCVDSASGPVTCMGQIPEYPQPIAVVVPPRYTPASRLILHLHGWLEGYPWDATPQAILDYFDFPALLAESHVDALFVLPFSLGHCATYDSDLVGGINHILSRLYVKLGVSLPSAITLSGHSGAWTPMERILEAPRTGFLARVDSAFLFDAAYPGFTTKGFKSLAHANAGKPQPRILSAYRSLTPTDFGTRRLSLDLGKAFESMALPEGSNHWDTVKAGLPRFLEELRD